MIVVFRQSDLLLARKIHLFVRSMLKILLLWLCYLFFEARNGMSAKRLFSIFFINAQIFNLHYLASRNKKKENIERIPIECSNRGKLS